MAAPSWPRATAACTPPRWNCSAASGRPTMRKLEAPQAGLSRILPLAGADYQEVLALNNANAVETSWLTERALRSLVAMACHATRIDEPGGIGALLIALDQHAPYDSPNFSWFKDRHRSFV